MKFVERKDIDLKKWEARIDTDAIENIFNRSWYLDAVADNWGAIITEDYKTILPVPYTIKLGLKQMYQAPFTREYDIVGSEFNWTEAAKFLAENLKAIHFRNAKENLFEDGETRQHQYLSLHGQPAQGYKTNAKRLIKKAKEKFSVELHDNPSVLIDLFKENVAHKIDSIGEDDLKKLDQLMTNALINKAGELWVIRESTEIKGAGFFLKDKSRVTYLKGASTDDLKKAGGMYLLIDSAINLYAKNFTTLDFGGSSIEGVANFYKKFGALDRTYYNYTIDRLPFWFKTLKRIKK